MNYSFVYLEIPSAFMFESCPPFQRRQTVESFDYSENPTSALTWIERSRSFMILSHEPQLCLLGKSHQLPCLKAVRPSDVDKPFHHLIIASIWYLTSEIGWIERKSLWLILSNKSQLIGSQGKAFRLAVAQLPSSISHPVSNRRVKVFGL